MHNPEVRFRPLPPDLQELADEQFAWSCTPIDQYMDRAVRANQERGATFVDGSTEFMPLYNMTPEGVMYTLMSKPLCENSEDDAPEDYFTLHNGSLCVMRRYYLADSEPLDEWREPTDEDMQLLTRALEVMQERKQPFSAWEAEFGLEDELTTVVGNESVPESETEMEDTTSPVDTAEPVANQPERQTLYPITKLYGYIGEMALATVSYLGDTARYARKQAQAWAPAPRKRAA